MDRSANIEERIVECLEDDLIDLTLKLMECGESLVQSELQELFQKAIKQLRQEYKMLTDEEFNMIVYDRLLDIVFALILVENMQTKDVIHKTLGL